MSPIDVNRTLRIAAVDVAVGRQPDRRLPDQAASGSDIRTKTASGREDGGL